MKNNEIQELNYMKIEWEYQLDCLGVSDSVVDRENFIDCKFQQQNALNDTIDILTRLKSLEYNLKG